MQWLFILEHADRWHTMKGTQAARSDIKNWLTDHCRLLPAHFVQLYTMYYNATITIRINDLKLHSKVCNWSNIRSAFQGIFPCISQSKKKNSNTKRMTKQRKITVFNTIANPSDIIKRLWITYKTTFGPVARELAETEKKSFAWLQSLQTPTDERIPFLSDGELTIIYLLYELMSSSLILLAPAMQNQKEQPEEFFSSVFRLCTENHSKCNLSSPSVFSHVSRNGLQTSI